MNAVLKKELRSYFRTSLGWVIAALLLLFGGIFTALFHFVFAYSDFSVTLNSLRVVLILAIPLLTMRSIAEDRHNGTEKLFFSLPLRTSQIILGKFFAMLIVFLLPTAIMALFPLLFSTMGVSSLSSAYTALLGYALMGISLIALCTLISSFFENQLLAGAVGVLSCLVLYFTETISDLIPASPLFSMILCLVGATILGAIAWRISKSSVLGVALALLLCGVTLILYFIKPSWFALLIPDFLYGINPFGRLLGFSYGYFDLGGALFYISATLLCLFLTVCSMDARRRA